MVSILLSGFIGLIIGVILMTLLRRLLHRENRQIWVKTIKTELLEQINVEISEELKLRKTWQNG